MTRTAPLPAEQPQRSISVIIPARNVATVLGQQLEALCRQDHAGAWDVVIVDNGSTDGTPAIAASFQQRLAIRVVRAIKRPSPAYARNVGVRASAGALLVFLDADDVADTGLLGAYASRASDFHLMGGRLDDTRLNDPVVAAWRYSATPSGLPVALGRFPFVLTANCAVTRDAFERLGGFDETLPFVGEDVDFSIRAQLAGFEIGWVPEALVHYRHRDSLAALATQQFVYGRGTVLLFKRYRHLAVREARVPAWRLAWWLLSGTRKLFCERRRRGQWLSFAAFLGGQVVESLRQRTWYLG